MRRHALVLLLSTGLGSVSLAQERLRVQCVGADGKAVANAEVRVAQWRPAPDGSGRYICSGPFVADAEGIAETVVLETYGGGRFRRWIAVRLPGELVGSLRCDERTPRGDGNPLRVTLERSRTVQGRIQVPDGISATGVTVALHSLASAPAGVPETYYPRTSAEPGLADAWPEWFETQTDAAGSFTIGDVPERCWLALHAQGPGLARTDWVPDSARGRRLDAAIELSLPTAIRVQGVASDDEGKPRAGVRVELRRRGKNENRLPFVAVTRADGAFSIDGLSKGDYDLSASVDAGPTGPAGVMLSTGIIVDENREELDVELEPVRVVEGVAVDSDGRVTPGVDIEARVMGGQLPFASATSGDDGTFRFALPHRQCYLDTRNPHLGAFERLLLQVKIPASAPPMPVRIVVDRKLQRAR